MLKSNLRMTTNIAFQPRNVTLARRDALRLAGGAVAGALLRQSAYASTPIQAGAIRWDAWYADSGQAREAQNTLGFPPWQTRAPWFAKVNGLNHLTAVGTQADIDQECLYAARGGLKYWAFVMYSPTSPLSMGWNLYQTSPNRHLIKWCGIIGPGFLGNDPFSRADLWQAKLDGWIAHFRELNYQKVRGIRPLLYILWSQGEISSYFGGEMRNFAASLEYLRRRCKAFRVGDPYIVIMAGGAPTSARIMRTVEADAISNYIPDMGPTPIGPVPWQVLDLRTQAFWASLSTQGVECIPIATTGWDTRARREHPESYVHEPPSETLGSYFVLPTDAQLKAHIRAARDFVHDHADACRSETLLIYSWNECDEGGNPLIPTLGRPLAKSLIMGITPISR